MRESKTPVAVPAKDDICRFEVPPHGRDEKRLSGWQFGLFTPAGSKKPAYDAFSRLPH